jgi:DHA1 family multidrug resistance protein-like MFS transporter
LLTYLVNTSPVEKRNNHLTEAATIQTVAGAFGYFVCGMLGEIGVSIAIIAQVVTLSVCGVLFYLTCEDDATTKLQEIRPKALFKEANPLAAFLAGGNIMTPAFVT